MLSLWDLKSWSYNILKEVEWDTNAYPAFLFTDFINNYYFNIITQWVINIFDWTLVKRLLLPFNEKSNFYTNYSSTTLTIDCESWDIEIFATTTDYPTTWKLFIDWNIVTYTWITSTSFTWVTWLVWNFTAWTVIRFAYDLPTDYASLIEVVYNWKYSLDIKDYNKITSEINLNNFGCIVRWKYLVLFNSNNYWDNLELKYNYKPTLLSADADEIIIPDDTYWMCIKYLAVWEMMYNRWEEARWKEVFLFWLARLREMYNYYNNQNSKDNNWSSYINSWSFKQYNF